MSLVFFIWNCFSWHCLFVESRPVLREYLTFQTCLFMTQKFSLFFWALNSCTLGGLHRLRSNILSRMSHGQCCAAHHERINASSSSSTACPQLLDHHVLWAAVWKKSSSNPSLLYFHRICAPLKQSWRTCWGSSPSGWKVLLSLFRESKAPSLQSSLKFENTQYYFSCKDTMLLTLNPPPLY